MSKHRRGKNNPPSPPERPLYQRLQELESSREAWIEAYSDKANELDRTRDTLAALTQQHHDLTKCYNETLNSLHELLGGAQQIVTDHSHTQEGT